MKIDIINFTHETKPQPANLMKVLSVRKCSDITANDTSLEITNKSAVGHNEKTPRENFGQGTGQNQSFVLTAYLATLGNLGLTRIFNA
jgi:hypothetical protein